ncbi:hypothetical protein EHO61_05540 [Leptospira fluminis]|uniref:Alpha/beta hydrolase n=1 Tax=Leptospira fluminis TaxID=2484979 RepID=A0A4R9GQL3_9LEPT|nr:hypothetical protein [Leptospira fluminis]TGK19980.1 hypothetical protein EHO61_05540 [Leptospira fluminis]
MKKTFALVRESYYFIVEIFSLIFSVATCMIPEQEADGNEKVDILIVPGFLSGPIYYKKLTRVLKDAGYNARILKIPPFFRDTNRAVNLLDSQLRSLPTKYLVIAHNTGGLLSLLSPDTSRRKIGTLITLGTPFQGTNLFHYFGPKDLRWKSRLLESHFNTFLFMDRFQPLAPWKEMFFRPKESSEFGQGRDLWFDVVGNFNLVRVEENLRTIRDYLLKNYPPAPDSAESPNPKGVPTSKPRKKAPGKKGKKNPTAKKKGRTSSKR